MAAAVVANEVTVLHGGVVVTMDDSFPVFRDGAVAVAGDRMADGPFPRDTGTVDLAGRVLLPGFVNPHVHTSQQLARGIADDVDLVTLLHGRIGPYESHMMEEDSYASTLLCGIELIRSGTGFRAQNTVRELDSLCSTSLNYGEPVGI